jgi:hypothetical protein
MVSVEDTIKTFLECLQISLHDKSEEERKKILQIMQKSIVDLCFTIVPDVDTLVSDRGIFQPPSPEKGAVMKAFFNEQRKAFFALATGLLTIKNKLDLLEGDRDGLANELRGKLEVMEKRINGVVQMRNTVLGSRPNTPGTKVGK